MQVLYLPWRQGEGLTRQRRQGRAWQAGETASAKAERWESCVNQPQISAVMGSPDPYSER